MLARQKVMSTALAARLDKQKEIAHWGGDLFE